MVSNAPNTKSRRPGYLEIAERLRAQIETGQLMPGQRLPSFARMRAQGVSQGAMERAYALLIAEGIVKSAAGSGVYVAPPRESASKPRTNVIGIPGQKEGYENSAYGAPILSGIQDVAYETNCGILLTRDFETTKLAMMDGVISVGPPYPLPPTMPWVSVFWHTNDAPCLSVDQDSGIDLAVRYLWQLGHRRIASLIVHWGEGYEHARQTAFRESLCRAGADPDPRWSRPLFKQSEFDATQNFAGHGYLAMKQWLNDDWNDLGCTAIVAHNDEAAVGILRALREAGLDVPRDVSVVGFDGTSTAAHADPPLTTIEVPLREIGALGMRLLLELIENNRLQTEPNMRVLPVRLRIGRSTAAPGK